MEDFTVEQINSAANRVREMQKRSAYAQNRTPPPEKPKTPPPKAEKPTENNPFSKILGLLDFKNFSFDEESKLILGIILLLSSSQADELLILALVYVML